MKTKLLILAIIVALGIGAFGIRKSFSTSTSKPTGEPRATEAVAYLSDLDATIAKLQ